MQWSRLLHLWSSKEAIGDKKKKKKREKVARAGMGYCPFSKIEQAHNRLNCIVAHSRLSYIVAHSGLSRHITG